jgi:hypothetical protein
MLCPASACAQIRDSTEIDQFVPAVIAAGSAAPEEERPPEQWHTLENLRRRVPGAHPHNSPAPPQNAEHRAPTKRSIVTARASMIGPRAPVPASVQVSAARPVSWQAWACSRSRDSAPLWRPVGWRQPRSVRPPVQPQAESSGRLLRTARFGGPFLVTDAIGLASNKTRSQWHMDGPLCTKRSDEALNLAQA